MAYHRINVTLLHLVKINPWDKNGGPRPPFLVWLFLLQNIKATVVQEPFSSAFGHSFGQFGHGIGQGFVVGVQEWSASTF